MTKLVFKSILKIKSQCNLLENIVKYCKILYVMNRQTGINIWEIDLDLSLGNSDTSRKCDNDWWI